MSSELILSLAFKIICILFSGGYTVYAFIFRQQLQKMNRAYTASQNTLFFTASLLNVVIGIFLLLFALVVL